MSTNEKGAARTDSPKQIEHRHDNTHSPTPPCDCRRCQVATMLADRRRIELAAIFARIDGFRGESAVIASIVCEIAIDEQPLTLRGLFYRVVLRARLADMSGREFRWTRLAVNRADFEDWNLVRLEPKSADRRFQKFVAQYGSDCAEVDAIPATELRRRLESFIEAYIPIPEWERLKEVEALERETFLKVLERVPS